MTARCEKTSLVMAQDSVTLDASFLALKNKEKLRFESGVKFEGGIRMNEIEWLLGCF